MSTIDVLDAVGATVALEKPLVPGRAAAAASRPVTLANEDFAVIDGLETAIASTNTKLDTVIGHVDGLETVIASTNTKLDTLGGYVDGLETLITSSNTKLDTLATNTAAAIPNGTNNIGDVDVLTVGGQSPAFGAGAANSATMRVTIDTGQVGSTVAHDAVGTGVAPLLEGGYAYAEAPGDVSADGDAVQAWYLRNGAQATVLTAAGSLIGGDSTNGLKTQLMTALPAGTNAIGKLAANAGITIGAVELAASQTLSTVTTVTTVAAVTAISNALPAGNNNIGDVDVASLPALAAGTAMVGHVGGTEYETVAASATDQVLGPTGGTGDYLSGVLIVPATTSPGAVSIKDGGGSAITIFTGGATSVSNLVPFFVPIGAKSGSGAWKVTTGTNVSAIGVGDFT